MVFKPRAEQKLDSLSSNSMGQKEGLIVWYGWNIQFPMALITVFCLELTDL